MLGELVNIGEEVVVNIPEDSRQWGYDPCPNGTVGKVVGYGTTTYGRIHNFGCNPGIYHNRSWLDVDVGDKVIQISSFYVELKDVVDYSRRLDAYREAGGWATYDKHRDFIKPLPETSFWEFDKVRCSHHSFADIEELCVVRIKWDNINQHRIDGSPMPLYDISDSISAGWVSSIDEPDLELISRGNVWKYFHGEPMEFSDLREEANLHAALGLEDEVRNPATSLYAWTLREAMAAIREGIADGFSQSQLLGKHRLSVKRFRDRDLGERVRAITLAEFTETAVEELTQKFGD